MADDPQPFATASQHTTQASIFSRRPSFFGGRHKHTPPKTPTAAQNPPPARTTTASPPTINLPPVSPIGDASALLDIHHDKHDKHDKTPSTPPRRRHASRHSISSTLGDFGTTIQRSRSASLRTNDSSGTTSNTSTSRTSSHRRTPSATLATSLSPEKPSTSNGPAQPSSRPALSISTFSRGSKQRSAENVRPDTAMGPPSRQGHEKEPLSAVEKPKTPFGRSRFPSTSSHFDPPPPLRRQDTAGTYGGNTMNYNSGGLGPAAPIPLPTGANPNVIFQHIQETASKRISTLDYLRKACVASMFFLQRDC